MRLRVVILAALVAIPLLGSCDVEKSDLDVKKIARTVAYSLPVFHLNQLPLDEDIARSAFDLFIDSLDPSRSYFLQSDIDAFSAKAGTLDKELRKGDITFAKEVFAVLMERIDNRTDFTKKLLEKGFDTSKSETFLWDRKDAPWPKDEAEWDDLWRKRVKNEYVARLVSEQVYKEEEQAAATNTIASAETSATNITASAGGAEEDGLEDANLSPDEFIMARYKQFKLTMESFDEEMLLQRYLTSFSQVYDPHSDYMSPSSVEDFDINMKLSLVGIGAMLRPDEGTARIVQIIPGGPADEDGRLKAGDKIVAVAEGDKEPVSILHWPLYKAVRLIRGAKDSKVVLTIIPASDRSGTRTKKIDLIRDEVKLEEQAAKGEVKDLDLGDGITRHLGVITLPDFYADFKATSNNEKDARRASSDVKKLINELMLKGIEGLVLDLRNNGGGSLVEAIDTAGLFISSGPIVQVKERGGVQVLPDADPEVNYDGPMIVLVNRLSASASEILAAALQDYKRAVIVGDKQTHGKGTVQTLMPLGSEKSRRGSLKLTTAGFYRINGGSTQLKGVTPDVIIPDYLDVMDLGEDSLQHALPWDTIRPAMYRAETGTTELIPLLAEQSKERLATNAEFQTYLVKREHLKERFETKTVSLSLKERVAEAEAEKELDDIQSGAFLDEDNKDKKNDIVLNEALHILSDMIDLKKPVQSALQAPALSSAEESPAR
ncbi:MAG: carboxy terminal-processing peptidase [Kiritimatiellales bacterium]|nr:carboxy terminal-processing peptidase [Kiritimatiellales bacterium]